MSSSRTNSGKLRMDKEPTSTKFTDPSHPAGKRREIDNVMKKARAGTNDYWDKKLLEVEEKDPNRWRHTGFKKMYIEGDENSSSVGESDRESNYRYKRNNGREREEVYRRQSRSRSRSIRKSPPTPPPAIRRREPPSDLRRSPRRIQPRSPGRIAHRSPDASRKMYRMQHSPPTRSNRSSRSPAPRGRRSPPSPPIRRRSPDPPSAPPSRKHGAPILPRSKRPPSPPRHMHARMRSESSGSSCTDDSCSVCSPSHHRRNKSRSISRVRRGPHSPPVASKRTARVKHNEKPSRVRPSSSPLVRSSKVLERVHREPDARDRMIRTSSNRANRVRGDTSPPEDPRLRNRPPEPPEEPQVPVKKKKSKGASGEKSKGKHKKLRRIKIEGEKKTKKPGSSSDSNDSDSDSEEDSPISTFTATTRLTLSERFGKMAQWSMDRSNMENMRITKDSAGGALKVMIEEGLDSSSLRGNSNLGQAARRFSYSPAPVGHFPEELSATAPSGIISWDDVRVRYEYYKSCGYLRDLNVEDYVKWEEWWYKYQDWLKQERYYEYMERQQMHRRFRKKIPISQRLN